MNINTLIDDFKEALAADETITGWCSITYGQVHKVYVNIDVQNPPGEDDCPYVALYPVSKSVGRAITKKGHGFEVVCCIYDDDEESSPMSNIVEYSGVKRLETFRKHVENALAGIDTGNVLLEVIDSEYETIETFPYMMCGMVVSFSESVIMGTDPLE